ncbi:MAG: nucleotide exchange factor GrpE [Bacteroidales bacterium]|nr:nucleotide exchange factor GrpE [Bacteroidales bacterium]
MSKEDKKASQKAAKEAAEEVNKAAQEVKENAQEASQEQQATEQPSESEENKKIAQLEEALNKQKDDYVRLMAEFENFRRRNTQEKLELVSVAAKDTIVGLLPTLDECEIAMKALAASDDNAAAKEGTEMIYNKLMAYLKSKGLERIEAMGQPFDTDLHEAVAQFPVADEAMKGKVFDVTKTGYTLSGKVIRFAQVVVGI